MCQKHVGEVRGASGWINPAGISVYGDFFCAGTCHIYSSTPFDRALIWFPPTEPLPKISSSSSPKGMPMICAALSRVSG